MIMKDLIMKSSRSNYINIIIISLEKYRKNKAKMENAYVL